MKSYALYNQYTQSNTILLDYTTPVVDNLQLFEMEQRSCKAQKDLVEKPRKLEFDHWYRHILKDYITANYN
ncbi:unnamed protein product [Debaryomyces fabryi]|nr:unnamed protein product [Debaryomyces fabryi]